MNQGKTLILTGKQEVSLVKILVIMNHPNTEILVW